MKLGSYKIGDTTKDGHVIALIHGQSDDVIVFDDSKGRPNWETRVDPMPPREKKVHNLYNRLYSRASDVRPDANRKAVENELARALFRGLSEADESAALAHFIDVEVRIVQEALVRARVTYAATSSVTAVGILGAVLMVRALVADASLDELAVGVGAGALGAWASVVQRAWKLNVRAFESPAYLAFQGSTRIALGSVFGGFALVAAKVGIVMAPLAGSSWGLAALSFTGGASERLIPELLSKTESAATGTT